MEIFYFNQIVFRYSFSPHPSTKEWALQIFSIKDRGERKIFQCYRNNNDKDHDDEKMGKLDSRLKEVGALPSYDFDQQGYSP